MNQIAVEYLTRRLSRDHLQLYRLIKVAGATLLGGGGGRSELSPSWMLGCARGSRARSCRFPDVPSGGLDDQ